MRLFRTYLGTSTHITLPTVPTEFHRTLAESYLDVEPTHTHCKIQCNYLPQHLCDNCSSFADKFKSVHQAFTGSSFLKQTTEQHMNNLKGA